MNKTMLIGAGHPEETRVALVENGQIQDFDLETSGSEQLRGSIYLAKVTRVEPSLQACFVDYGGNRHGFLAFSEIHPDYYQLPQEDRDRILEEAAREAAESDDDFDDQLENSDDSDEDIIISPSEDDTDNADSEATEEQDSSDENNNDSSDSTDEEDAQTDSAEASDDGDADTEADDSKPAAAPARRNSERRSRRPSGSRHYKIQEVIRRRQVLLVQVVKEERGNKGAALTTFLSLAGRYSVLMPNTPRGGGISRKIINSNDRKRLKSIMSELDVPKGMGLIVRTAGSKRTNSEIRRDYDYLRSLWSQIRTKTLDSTAPSLIHQEGGLVHRAIRDMFDSSLTEVIVQGDAAYREAKDLAKTLMPGQARKVKRWTSKLPLFATEGIEDQLEDVFSPTVQMKSGGYLVIHQTEALVAIDVNSGKSTRERSIEQTALKTNLEAAEEACRQMRLRDLAGLVVIDFIDMDENKNNRAVEKKMKECLKLDRARVQNSRISQFGLMEISRQRRRAGITQAISEPCTACDGTGHRRTVSSAGLQLLRVIEARAATGRLKSLSVTAPTDVALFILNTKRDALLQIETDAGFSISITSSSQLIPGEFKVDAEKDSQGGSRGNRKFDRSKFIEGDEDDHLLPDPSEDEADGSDEDSQDGDGDDKDASLEETGRKKRRRRGRRGGRKRRREDDLSAASTPPSDGAALLDGLAASFSYLLADEVPELPQATLGGLEAEPVKLATLEPISEKPAAEAAEKNEKDANTEGDGRRKRRRRRRRRDSDEKPATSHDEAVELTEDAGASVAEAVVLTESEGAQPDEQDTSASTMTIDAVMTDEPVTDPANEAASKPADDQPAVTVDVPDQTDIEVEADIEADAEIVATNAASETTQDTAVEAVDATMTTTSTDDAGIVEPEKATETAKPEKRKRRGWWSRK